MLAQSAEPRIPRVTNRHPAVGARGLEPSVLDFQGRSVRQNQGFRKPSKRNLVGLEKVANLLSHQVLPNGRFFRNLIGLQMILLSDAIYCFLFSKNNPRS